MGATPSYAQRALAEDYEQIRIAEEILNGQDFNNRPRPDISSTNELFFVCHEQLSNRVTQDLVKAGWQCEDVHCSKGVVYHFTKKRSTDYSLLLMLTSMAVDFVAVAMFTSAVFSYKVMFELYGVMWFEPGTVASLFT